MKIAFIHGWGLNSAIWRSLQERIDDVVLIDIPGYGNLVNQPSSSDLRELADACLEQVTEPALWVGWSLGGMIAMQSALQDQQGKVLGLQLVNSTPKFVYADDWQHGVKLPVFQKFCDDLSADYQRMLKSFLLLQAGSSDGSRDLARQAATAISDYSAPSQQTLQLGIDGLRDWDLRSKLSKVVVPTQVVCGVLDRVTAPQSSYFLAEELDAELVEIHAGHAPFLTHVDDYLSALHYHRSTLRSLYDAA